MAMSYLKLIPDEHQKANISNSNTAQGTLEHRPTTTPENAHTESNTTTFLVLTPCLRPASEYKHTTTARAQDVEPEHLTSDART